MALNALRAALQDALQGKQVQRITFTEVSQKAVEAALANPRQVDSYLVDAYKARRTLDYLLGYGISPILWTKLGGAKSAGASFMLTVLHAEHESLSFKRCLNLGKRGRGGGDFAEGRWGLGKERE